jgi:hypothetical protein
MVATPATTGPTARPPPPLPSDPAISNTLSNYLQQFSLWCRQGFAAKINNNTALTGILLQAANAPAGVVPNVYLLQVGQNGTLAVTQVTVGGPSPTI